MDILIIGSGMVGKAVKNAFLLHDNRIEIIDPAYGDRAMDNIFLELHPWTPDFTFICLPTPTVNGWCDISVIKTTLARHKRAYPYSQVVIKSTITPDRLEELAKIDDCFIYNPDFLRADDANADFIWPSVQVYGGDTERCRRLSKLYQNYSSVWDNAKEIYTSHRCASLYKYSVNTFLAMKVTWANEMAQLFTNPQDDDWDWEVFQHALGYEPRIGSSHMQVPGPDGMHGFGGACFPKDTEALETFMENEGVMHTLLSTTIETNRYLREQDEFDKGVGGA